MIELIPPPNFSDIQKQALFDYRLGRIREEMLRQGVFLCILNNPVSLRYAINFDEYQLFQSHIAACYLFVPIEGPLLMFGAGQHSFPNVMEYRRPDFLSPFDGGFDLQSNCDKFLQTIISFVREHQLADKGSKVGVERFTTLVSQGLRDNKFQVVDAECIMEKAKLIKSPMEIECLKYSIAVAEYGIDLMRQQLQPGMTENQLWAILHQVNISHGGDWIEGHMLASGSRTNPWFQEASARIIEQGDMVALDTDMIGPNGFMADISRSWICGGGKGNQQQRDAYQHAFDEIHYNMDLVKPGISFKELSDSAFNRKSRYRAHRYPCCFHGVGYSDEYPKIYYPEDWEQHGYDGLIEENMVLCVESYSGVVGEKEGVKLEDMIQVTRAGYSKLSTYTFEKTLLG